MAFVNEFLNARLAMLDESHLDSYETFVCKTTILGALLGAIDPHERIVVVGGAEEVRPRHPHVVRLVARPVTIEGAGGVPLGDLVRQALRTRPDRLAVGEVRPASSRGLPPWRPCHQ